ncbi:unnamed protein product [Vitrella brassicaformis CCMP3155]|uniref:C3H1-type domain-containing protein n=1 Tax=Vitrella brassicaformis (strain CCMP3155) TaxID=1169540 RepID=A0A0G4H1Y9_VITBC|nr:unnamed protein product [Vitrella brassicaformis CCMP3155]|eukprot:CEM37642.1 unnamed protein product [Vitrella brassicaformis CCMP3155]
MQNQFGQPGFPPQFPGHLPGPVPAPCDPPRPFSMQRWEGNRRRGPAGIIETNRSRFEEQLRKTRLCKWHQAGRCTWGAQCRFAHGLGELRQRPDLSRTSLCPDLQNCRNPFCTFAHSKDALRTTNFFVKTKVCHDWLAGRCYRPRCKWAHHLDDMQEDVNTDGQHEPHTGDTQQQHIDTSASAHERPGVSVLDSTPVFHPLPLPLPIPSTPFPHPAPPDLPGPSAPPSRHPSIAIAPTSGPPVATMGVVLYNSPAPSPARAPGVLTLAEVGDHVGQVDVPGPLLPYRAVSLPEMRCGGRRGGHGRAGRGLSSEAAMGAKAGGGGGGGHPDGTSSSPATPISVLEQIRSLVLDDRELKAAAPQNYED